MFIQTVFLIFEYSTLFTFGPKRVVRQGSPQSDYQEAHSTKIVGNSHQVGSLFVLFTFFRLSCQNSTLGSVGEMRCK